VTKVIDYWHQPFTAEVFLAASKHRCFPWQYDGSFFLQASSLCS